MIDGGKRDEDGGVPPMRPLTLGRVIPSRPIKRPNGERTLLAPGSRPERQTLDKGLP